MASLHLAYQDALESAVVRVSESRLASPDQQTLASRIEAALKALDELQLGQIPAYSSPDVALFYSHWYLPEQVNLAYTLSAELIARRGERWQTGRSMQLIDLGAGSGAMVLGLTLAIAQHLPRERWPNVVAVYQIDNRSMLDVGDQIWRSLRHIANTSGRSFAGSQPRWTASAYDITPCPSSHNTWIGPESACQVKVIALGAVAFRAPCCCTRRIRHNVRDMICIALRNVLERFRSQREPLFHGSARSRKTR